MSEPVIAKSDRHLFGETNQPLFLGSARFPGCVDGQRNNGGSAIVLKRLVHCACLKPEQDNRSSPTFPPINLPSVRSPTLLLGREPNARRALVESRSTNISYYAELLGVFQRRGCRGRIPKRGAPAPARPAGCGCARQHRADAERNWRRAAGNLFRARQALRGERL